MRKIISALLLVASPALAVDGISGVSVSQLGACSGSNIGELKAVNNSDGAVTGACVAGEGETALSTCQCNGAQWMVAGISDLELAEVALATDLEDYAPLAGAEFVGAVSVAVGEGDPEVDVADGVVTVSGALLYVDQPTAPTAADDECVAGTVVITSGFLYFCAATDTWVRAALATWP